MIAQMCCLNTKKSTPRTSGGFESRVSGELLQNEHFNLAGIVHLLGFDDLFYSDIHCGSVIDASENLTESTFDEDSPDLEAVSNVVTDSPAIVVLVIAQPVTARNHGIRVDVSRKVPERGYPAVFKDFGHFAGI
jgi:hypothetical protein